MTHKELLSERDRLLEMTRLLDEHPEGYEGPCLCKLCLLYAAQDASLGEGIKP